MNMTTTTTTTYRLGSIDTRRDGNQRPLIDEDDHIIAYVESDAGPALIGEMSEQTARRKFPSAFRARDDA